MSWPPVSLAEVCTINPKSARPLADDDKVSFLGMADVSENGSTTLGVDRPFAEVRKGYTSFEDGDVLLAKITPCFQNAKIAQARLARPHGFGSTEFHVLRGTEHLDQRYLLHFLRRDRVLIEGERRMTGSGGQRRVPVQFLQTLKIPLPPLPEQRRIAAILDHADTLRAKRSETLRLLDDLVHSAFHARFEKNRSLPCEGVTDLCDVVVDCVNKTAPVVDYVTPFKMIRTTNVRDYRIDLRQVRYVTSETYDKWSRRVKPLPGDIILTREAPVGEVGIVTSNDSIFLGQRLMLYRPNPSKLLSEYLLYALRADNVQRQFGRLQSGSTVKHLAVPACKKVSIPVPTISEQEDFAKIVLKVRRQRELLAAQNFGGLFSSLQSRAFRGEL